MTDFTLSSGNVCLPHRSPWGAFPTKQYQVSTGVSSAAIVRGRVVTLDYTEAGNSTAAGQVKASTGDNFFYGVGIAASMPSIVRAVRSVRPEASYSMARPLRARVRCGNSVTSFWKACSASSRRPSCARQSPR